MRPRWLVSVLIAALLCWFFGSTLLYERVLDFRDIGHYYRPLWQWTSSEWAAGRVPLWCDLDGLGLPIHADPTASTFYPGQLLFALPLSLTTRINLYVVLHILLAAALTYRTARGLGASRAGASAAALSYAFGGHVLFQYCNPIYLVGSAWLPLAVLAIERTCSRRSWRWAMVLAVSLALILLGGDLHLAYHVGMLAVLYVWLQRKEAAFTWRIVALLGGGLLLAGLLSAVQVLPTAQWSSHSERASADNPRSLWELQREGKWTTGFFGDPAPNSHHERIYEFSIGPWRWLEFVWPNIGGRMFPQHQRWMSALPAEARIWSPSLYLGLIPFIIALATFSLRRKADVNTRWLSWIAVMGVLGSLGIYGLGWLWQEIRFDLLGGDPNERSVFGAVGGLYWFFVVVLPGYVQFRYPAKLMVLAALAISLLAARGWGDVFAGAKVKAWFWWVVIGIVVCGSAIALGVSISLSQVFTGLPGEFPFGPLQAKGARRDVMFAAVHGLLLAMILYALVRMGRGRTWMSFAAVAITAVDLCVANGWLVSSSAPAVAQRLQWPVTEAPLRVYRGDVHHFSPDHWTDTAASNRVAEVLAWQERSLGEKCFLSAGIDLADAQSTLEPADVAAVWHAARTKDELPGVDRHGVGPALAVSWRLTVVGDPPTVVAVGPGPGDDWPAVYAPRTLLLNESQQSRTPQGLLEAARETFYPHGSAADRRKIAVVEIDQPTANRESRKTYGSDLPDDALRLRRVSPTHVEIDADLPEARLIVLADYFAAGWAVSILDRATGEARPGEIVRTNRVLRGVFAPAGEQTLIFRYRPWSLYLGAIISGIAWCGVLVTAAEAVTTKYTKRTKETEQN